eukprot:3566295-Pleurochrysis_carterae.AAC.4
MRAQPQKRSTAAPCSARSSDAWNGCAATASSVAETSTAPSPLETTSSSTLKMRMRWSGLAASVAVMRTHMPAQPAIQGECAQAVAMGLDDAFGNQGRWVNLEQAG